VSKYLLEVGIKSRGIVKRSEYTQPDVKENGKRTTARWRST
jgi:hypothetical protein